VTDPADYEGIVAELERAKGVMSFEMRLNLARKAFAHTAAYDTAIAAYLKTRTLDEVRKCYRFEE